MNVALLQETKLSEDRIQNVIDYFDRLIEFLYLKAIAHSVGVAVLIRKVERFSVYPEWEYMTKAGEYRC